jgi:hypothetical protein
VLVHGTAEKPASHQLLPAGVLCFLLSGCSWLLVLACSQAVLALGTGVAAVVCLNLKLQELLLESCRVVSPQQQFAVGCWYNSWGQFLQLLVVLLQTAWLQGQTPCQNWNDK